MRRALALSLAVPLVLAGCLGPGAPGAALDASIERGAPSCAPCLVALDASDAEAFEPMVAADPNDPMRLVAGASAYHRRPDGDHRWNHAYVSTDGGATWTGAPLPGGPSAGKDHPLATATDMGDPVVAVLRDGTVVYVGMALQMVPAPLVGGVITGYTLYVGRSTDGGLTWPEFAIVSEGHGVAAGPAAAAWRANDKPWIAEGPDGTLLLAWSLLQLPPLDAPQDLFRNDLVFSTSRDGGRTWTAPAPIARGGAPWGGAAPVVTVDAWHVAVATYERPAAIHLFTSRDEGRTWESLVVDDEAAASFPNLVAAPRAGGDALLLSYSDAEGDLEAPALLESTDGGRTWSAPLRLDGPFADIWSMPSLAVDAEGTAWVSYFRASGKEGPREHVVAAVRDGALVGHLRIDDGLEGKTGARGHYMGIAGLSRGAFAVWVTGDAGAFDLVGARLG